MEQLSGGGLEEERRFTAAETEAAGSGPVEESWGERVIREGIEAAVTEGRPIDHRTARYIASQLHDGQPSALYALASSGAISPEAFDELNHDRAEQPTVVRRWMDCLTVYCAARTDPGPVDGWLEQAEAGDRLDLVRRISAGGVTTLGQIAVVLTPGEAAEERDADDGVDDFPWGDAATWTPDGSEDAAAAARARFDLTDEEFDSLFAGDADEELGDMNELGWFGLVRWPERAGGLVLKVDSDGNRHTWVLDADDQLEARWGDIQATYEQYEAYGLAIAPSGETQSGLHPRIWVGSLADYNAGNLHGEWFDALLEPEQLELAAKYMLRSGRVPGAEEWGIFDYDEFYGVELGEYESFATVSKVARGLAEHGEAYGHWVEYVGTDSEQADRFDDHFRGEWPSFKAYLEDYLDGCGLLGLLQQIPEEMQPYVEVDYDALARDWQSDFHVVESRRGGVWVYEPSA
jgi:antirestriction protein